VLHGSDFAALACPGRLRKLETSPDDERTPRNRRSSTFPSGTNPAQGSNLRTMPTSLPQPRVHYPRCQRVRGISVGSAARTNIREGGIARQRKYLLPAASSRGRCWVRTSDPCVVSANDEETNPDQLELFARRALQWFHRLFDVRNRVSHARRQIKSFGQPVTPDDVTFLENLRRDLTRRAHRSRSL
jgi:hypothetical protein